MYCGSPNLAGVPHCWVERIQHSIRTLAWRFQADRMAQDYVQHLNCPPPSAAAARCPRPDLPAVHRD